MGWSNSILSDLNPLEHPDGRPAADNGVEQGSPLDSMYAGMPNGPMPPTVKRYPCALDRMVDESTRRDVFVLGATPGGIAAAVRAARAGLDVELVTYHAHVGGMMTGGLSRTDTTVRDPRTPLYDSFREAVLEHYSSMYGADSPQVSDCNDGKWFEPHVGEAIFDEMLATEDGISITWEHHVTGVERDGRQIGAVTLAPVADGEPVEFAADTFIDATYEGDLFAAAGVPGRVGREARWEYDEPHAGVLFSEKGTRIFHGSTGDGDTAVQSYDYRVTLSKNPETRRRPARPDEYDREEYLPIVQDPPEADPDVDAGRRVDRELPCDIKSEMVRPTVEDIRDRSIEAILMARSIPNDKADMNTADLPGEADEYPEGDWETRDRIAKRHRDHALGLLYFLHNDTAVPDDIQEEARKWGLATDEFTDNDNFPFQLYVREARRLAGRWTFTENDARLAVGLQRAPVHDTAIAIAEYPMDSHDCRPVRRPGTLCDGHFYLPEITVPSQVPWETLLARDVDNLLVPVALSATHVGFGGIRLEPTWMQIGESAGLAAALAAEADTPVASIDVAALQAELAERGSMLSYFDDCHPLSDGSWAAAVQYVSTKGFFRGYRAAPEAPLDPETASVWARATAAILEESLDAMAVARALPAAPEGTISPEDFLVMLTAAIKGTLATPPDATDRTRAFGHVDTSADVITRGEACEAIYAFIT